MNNGHIRILLSKLNDFCATGIENGAEFAAVRSHYEVNIEHVLIKMLEQGGGDIDRLFRYYEIDMDELWEGMLEFLSKQRAANAGKPVLSAALFQWLEKAWLASSLYYDATCIRSVSLIDALIELSPGLYNPCFDQLDKINLTHLRNNYARLVEGSLEAEQSAGRSPVSASSPAISKPLFNKPATSTDKQVPSSVVSQVNEPVTDLNKTGTNNKSAPDLTENKESQVKQSGQRDTLALNPDSALGQYAIDVTAQAEQGQIDPVLGRNTETRQVIDILSRRRKNNPILVGEPGVGKTAVVEGLALKIASGDVPSSLINVRLFTLDLGLLQAGAGVKGEFEKRLKQVIQEVEESDVPIVLFIDEAHTLIGSGGMEGGSDAANLLKPALARGHLKTIAATTWAEYKKYFERDAALERRFQLVKVEEPSIENAIVMLSGLKEKYQDHHNTLITDEAIDAAVNLSSRYINGRYLPDKAIDLIDTAAARIKMGQATVPSSLESARDHIIYIEKRLKHLQGEQKSGLKVSEKLIDLLEKDLLITQERLQEQQLQWTKERTIVEKIHAQENNPDPSSDKSATLKSAREELGVVQGERPLVQAEVNAEAIGAVVSDWTGIPVGKMIKNELTSLINFEDIISQRVIGQDEAIGDIGRAMRTARSGMSNPDAPLGVFLLSGPSGVGKTETALAMADALYGGERYLITINMSEYQEAHSVSQLKGSPPGYVGYGEGGVLTEAVRQRPYSVILLDEVEKAHLDVLNMFYQVFDRGFMRDGEGREIDFKNTVILMTSNIGSTEVEALYNRAVDLNSEIDSENMSETEAQQQLDAISEQLQTPAYAEISAVIQEALGQYFPSALIGRMQSIAYKPLNDDIMQGILALKLENIAQRLYDTHEIEFRCDPAVLTLLAGQCTSTVLGARAINAMLEQRLLPEISRSLLGFMVDDDIPDILTLSLDEDQQLSCVFSDKVNEQTKENDSSSDAEPAEALVTA
ncbi:ClpB-like protein [hydrothermal vent metagenome]|uniref:ClpB-like protein n=1 Tax=hydrothermal vent metagenome TaxID=652676 RepID=A0A3B0YHE4_9ZZZZ